ncbi:MAG: hypothetical protein O3B95_12120 [Chloroflexi bacterium]|nr:hypothetical protein [Chloroflexota bacterium]
MSTGKRFTFLIALMIGVALALTACGDTEPAVQVAAESNSATQPTLESESVSDSAAAPTPEREDPPEISVVPAEVPEPGSTKEEVLAALERQVRSINTQDWAGFAAQCSTGSKRKVNDVEKVKFIFEELGGAFGYDIPSFSIYGYNARNVDFTIYSAKNARATFDIYNHDSWVASGVSRTFERVDGEWLSDGAECYPI